MLVLEATWLAPARLWLLANSFVGRILVLGVPPLLVVASLALLLVLTLADRRQPGPRAVERLLFAAAALTCVAAISLGLYLTWTSPGAATVRGLQGRYLYPLVPFALFALSPPRRMKWTNSSAALVTIVALGANLWGIASVIAATWLGAA
jgi:uncharacterized membrane protein